MDFININNRKYGNIQKEKAYRNAITCLYNGLNKSAWNSCGLSWYDADEIWQEAENTLKELCVGKSA